MLLVGDIHINSRYKDDIIDTIKSYIEANSDQNEIVFLGDYVYHFSYDRKSLLALLDLFLDLYKSGKTVYVLCGNHDWISESFVYQEAASAFEVVNKISSNNSQSNKIYFIKEVLETKIDGENILFFPYNFDLDFQEKSVGADGFAKPDALGNDGYQKIASVANELLQSSNKNEQISGKINLILLDYIKKYEGEKLIVFHHYYFANTKFPGQKAQFKFRDISLTDLFMSEFNNVFYVSGHLHQGFVLDNYFCSGSLWHTSPLEINQYKFLYELDPKTLEIKGTNVNINPYLFIEGDKYGIKLEQIKQEDSYQGDGKNISDNPELDKTIGTKIEKSIDPEIEQLDALFDAGDIQSGSSEIVNVDLQPQSNTLTKEIIKAELKEIYENSILNFAGGKFKVKFNRFTSPKLAEISLTIKLAEIDYSRIEQLIEGDMISTLKDVKLKKDSPKMNEVLSLLDSGSKDLQSNISDWKNLLKEYIDHKFGEDGDQYINKLKELKVL